MFGQHHVGRDGQVGAAEFLQLRASVAAGAEHQILAAHATLGGLDDLVGAFATPGQHF
ncbi:hypothetical protein D3C87_2167270 [compost metagenome]